jgi:hypothetical protein
MAILSTRLQCKSVRPAHFLGHSYVAQPSNGHWTKARVRPRNDHFSLVHLLYHLHLATLVHDSNFPHEHAAQAHESDTKHGSEQSSWSWQWANTIHVTVNGKDKVDLSRQVSVHMVHVYVGNQGD